MIQSVDTQENCLTRANNMIPSAKYRNLFSFWMFGLCNNYSYVIMLSAAHDILSKLENNTMVPTHAPTLEPVSNHSHNGRNLDCTQLGTGAILLADVLPTLLLKFLAPAFLQRIHFDIKILAVVLFAVSSFLIVSFSNSIAVSILGVVLASCSSGLGELTFLSMTAYFDKNVVSTWSSGTGGAGVVGALSYAGLTQFLSPSKALLVILFVPMLIGVVYVYVLQRPPHFKSVIQVTDTTTSSSPLLQEDDDEVGEATRNKAQTEPTVKVKFQLFLSLLPLMIPLATVYLFEYLINQSLFELLYYEKAFLNHKEQYRWYQVLYQVGVFISRSSVNVFKIRKIWLLSILQIANFILLLVHIIVPFIPSIWIIFVIILYEGLLGGLAYVNTFYTITVESEARYKEFNMATAAFGDSLGITVAGAIAIPLHNYLCKALSN